MDKREKLTYMNFYVIMKIIKGEIKMEIKEIPGLPGYLATTDGRIYSQKTHNHFYTFINQSATYSLFK